MLSTRSVFHFTRGISPINNIIKEGFKVSFSNEKFILSGDVSYIEMQIPMISFCDIPLSQIKDHVWKYGSFGIGLTKEWAERKKLNPVIYISKHSYLAESIQTTIEQYSLRVKANSNQAIGDDFANFDITRYVKNFEGRLERKGKLMDENYRFSDEREWRYVPKHNNDNSPYVKPRSLLQEEGLNFDDYMRPYLEEISHIRLKFEISDISYLILKCDLCVSEFFNLIHEEGGISEEDINYLRTKVLTVEQIEGDF